jgi:RNA 2',3'-cyclic 3'-phosphodiesterase
VPSIARLFFALWPDAAMQAALYDSVSAIVRESDGRAVPAENFHLTLAFLGSVARNRIDALNDIAARCAANVKPAELPLVVTLDTFEHWRRPHILCATASVTSPAIVTLAKSLKRALTAEGFTPDLKPFRAHATFARKVHRVADELTATPVSWSFDTIHLIESRTESRADPHGDPAGSAYSTVEKWVLYKRDH